MLDRIRQNPFYVLDLRPSASMAEIERQGQKLLGMVELGISSAKRYSTPAGEESRDADLIRRAVAELRDPQRRLAHELWAALPPKPVKPFRSEAKATSDAGPKADAPWPEAFEALGFGGQR